MPTSNPDTHRDNLAPDISVYTNGNVPHADAKMDRSQIELFIREFVSPIADAMVGN